MAKREGRHHTVYWVVQEENSLDKDLMSERGIVVRWPEDGTYLSGDNVMAAAVQYFYRHDINTLMLCGQLLVRIQAWRYARRHGLRVVWRRVGWVGFDRDPANEQPWTRGPFALTKYAIGTVFGRHGPAKTV